MAISKIQHLKNTEVPDWVVVRLRKYVDDVGGKKVFMSEFNLSDSYMSMLWNGKRHPPAPLLNAIGVRIITEPLKYELIEGV